MRVWDFGIRAAAFGVSLLAISPLVATNGWAARSTTHAVTNPTETARAFTGRTVNLKNLPLKMTSRFAPSRKGPQITSAVAHGNQIGAQIGSKRVLLKGGKARYYGSNLQCVPFARAATGIEIKGNAANWWDAANGVYARGQAPESGSVLNFRANGHMRLGHVAVVTRVIDSREIEIDHANWAGPGASKGGVSRSTPVQDVSEANDWSAVRVGLGHSGSYGSVYPTYGFIYDRPDNGMMASNPRATTMRYDEVAEAPTRAIR